MFDNDEFQRLNYKYGPFTLDACASAFDAKCPEYCSIDKPFETDGFSEGTEENPSFLSRDVLATCPVGT